MSTLKRFKVGDLVELDDHVDRFYVHSAVQRNMIGVVTEQHDGSAYTAVYWINLMICHNYVPSECLKRVEDDTKRY